MRGYIRDARSYLPPVQIGETMRAMGLGVVVKVGKQSALSVGQLVTGAFGWTEFAVMKDKNVDKITPFLWTLVSLINLNSTGLTAYFGLRDVCDLKPGDKMVVSGAAGSVGSIACQLGKRAGATVYAIAGSQDKCEWLEKELGVDKAFNYKSPTFRDDLSRRGARIALCGAISQYNATKPKGLQNYQTLISMRAKMQGFIMHSRLHGEFPAAIEEMARGLADGSIKRKFHIVEGLEQAPVALPMLFSGGNTGKLVVKVSEEPRTKL
ncbi:hypothetical protein B0H13DRAFT_2247571 [Mycena leptocephala]|nr:hypothetical protein B0H13DRAFT_2247571 [Mycena leptocephala]